MSAAGSVRGGVVCVFVQESPFSKAYSCRLLKQSPEQVFTVPVRQGAVLLQTRRCLKKEPSKKSSLHGPGPRAAPQLMQEVRDSKC